MPIAIGHAISHEPCIFHGPLPVVYDTLGSRSAYGLAWLSGGLHGAYKVVQYPGNGIVYRASATAVHFYSLIPFYSFPQAPTLQFFGLHPTPLRCQRLATVRVSSTPLHNIR